MAKILMLCLLAVIFVTQVTAGKIWGDGDLLAFNKGFGNKKCDGLIGECFPEEEMMMDSESNRRILATRQYISYGSLRADAVPCGQKGTSYYNCRSSGQANPYQRACTVITRCARDTS
uniref:TSA: Wollemia nobilis Ref_Wollemi_Transcript_28556_534 transcribed RNA sequence n=1 Tax=Wollemia nobilis TaxID=56998 RepID=A0A0C9S3P2_9CONI